MKKRRLLGFLLSLALMMTMMPALAFAEDAPDAENAETQEVASEHDPTVENAEAQDAAAEEAPDAPKKEKAEKHQVVKTEDVSVQDNDHFNIWIGGEKVKKSDPKGDGWEYSQAEGSIEGTLTLKCATINESYIFYKDQSANIYSEGINLTIVLEGENTVGDNNSLATYAINITEDDDEVGGNLIIQGSGKITAAADYVAISADYNTEIKGGKITATSGGRSGIEGYYRDVIISGGDIEVVSNGGDAIYADDNVTISGGIVNATVKRASYDDGAIYADDSNLTISGNDTVVNAEVVCDKEEDAEYCYALYGEDNIEISGGKVNVKVSNGGSYCHAICAECYNVTIRDSKVIAETDGGNAIYGDEDIAIEYTESGKYSTYVEAEVKPSNSIDLSGMPPAIISYGNLTKGENLAITTPKGGMINTYHDEFDTIMVGENYATHAVIQPAAYKIDVADTTGGKVKTEPAKAGEGEVVKVVTTPDEGNEVDKIIIIDEDGIETDITEKSMFTMGRSNVTVKVTFRKKIGPTITTIAKTSAKTTTVKWSWDKATDATSYKLAYRKAGSNEWKVKNTKKTKYVIKRQKLKGLYEYKVAAVTSDGDVWSDVSCRYFKGVQARARVSKGAIKVKWKKDKGATGYEILIAKNKKMNDAQVIQVAPTAKSYKVAGLEKGKYYVKVRPVKEYNGVTYTGVLCKARKVRIK